MQFCTPQRVTELGENGIETLPEATLDLSSLDKGVVQFTSNMIDIS